MNHYRIFQYLGIFLIFAESEQGPSLESMKNFFRGKLSTAETSTNGERPRYTQRGVGLGDGDSIDGTIISFQQIHLSNEYPVE